MSDLLLEVYFWGESLKAWPPLLTTIVGGTIVAIVTLALTLWFQKQIREHKELKQLTEVAKGGGSEADQQSARKELLKRTKKTVIWILLFVGGFILFYFAISNEVDEIHDKLRTTRQEYIRNIDELKKILKRKTIKKSIQTVCADGAIRDLERTRSENICLLEASRQWNDEESEGGTNRLINAEAYEVCMAKKGWLVRKCEKGEKECITLQTGRGCCEQTVVKTESENMSIQCLASEKEEALITRWELICSNRAEIEGEYKAQDDAGKISIMSKSYQACMLEQGWFTQQCTASEQGCVKITYIESACTKYIRKWLEGRADPSEHIACLEEKYKQ